MYTKKKKAAVYRAEEFVFIRTGLVDSVGNDGAWCHTRSLPDFACIHCAKKPLNQKKEKENEEDSSERDDCLSSVMSTSV